MSITPKKKTSKSRTNKRTTNWIRLTAKKVKDRTMLNKEWTWLAHMVDENWKYNGKIIIVKKKKGKTTRI
jgi:ribosomal protein L32